MSPLEDSPLRSTNEPFVRQQLDMHPARRPAILRTGLALLYRALYRGEPWVTMESTLAED